MKENPHPFILSFQNSINHYYFMDTKSSTIEIEQSVLRYFDC